MKNLLWVLPLAVLLACSRSEESYQLPHPTVSSHAQFDLMLAHTGAKKLIERDTHAPQGGFRPGKRRRSPELTYASQNAPRYTRGKGKGSGKPPKGPDTPPTDTTGGGGGSDTTGGGTDPGSGPASVVLLDFDGHYLKGSSWNVSGPLDLRYSGMTAAEIAATVAAVQRDYDPFDVLVTADSTEFYKRPVGRRMRVVLTESWEWYGQAGGVAYVGSFNWADDTPCFVFTSLLGYNSKFVGDAASHEAGHTLGLRHQCDWKDGVKVSEYSQGFTQDRAPIMGVAYYDQDGGEWVVVTPWFIGTWYIRTSFGGDQNDYELLVTQLGVRKSS